MNPLFSVKYDIKSIEAALFSFEKRHFPFAASKALNDTAWDVYWSVQKQLPKIFDKPTPWTLKAMYVVKSNKKTLIAEVGYKGWATKGTASVKIMGHHVSGGSRPYKRSETLLAQAGVIPPGSFLVRASQAPRDEYGNVPKSKISKMISGLQATLDTAQRSKGRKAKRFYVDTMRGGSGNKAIFERLYGESLPLFLVVKSVNYKPVFPIQQMVDDIVKAKFPINFKNSMDKALATAK